MSKDKQIRWRVSGITGLMVAIFVFFQFLPDFAPERPATLLMRMTGDPSPDLCDVESLGFTRVNANRSPLTMRVYSKTPLKAGEEATVLLSLTTPGGKPVGEEDLMVAHTRKVHLLLVDPTLEDYHHIHPEPTAVKGEYEFRFTPESGGDYRIFADLLPVATARPVQAVADLEVAGKPGEPAGGFGLETVVEDYRFALEVPPEGLAVKKPAVISLRVTSDAGQGVKLEPVMGAYAHLVAFDGDRSGFAHMHPVKDGVDHQLDPVAPALDFIFYVTEPGDYMAWAQVIVEGEETFAPFLVSVP